MKKAANSRVMKDTSVCMRRPGRNSSYNNRSSFVSVNRNSIFHQSHNEFKKASSNNFNPDEGAADEGD